MTARPIAVAVASIMLTTSAMADDLLDQAKSLFKPIPFEPSPIEGNAVTPAKVELGKKLFFEPRLSQSHNIACSTCHNLGLGGGDALETSIGHRSQHGGRNAPTVLNAAYNTAQFWDGRAKDLMEQAGGPLVNPIEMAVTAEHVIEQLKSVPGYVTEFKAVFSDDDEPITLVNVEQAIAAFEATLITPNAPFDRYLRGETDALTAEQKEGLQLFMDKGCVSCHDGINVGGGQYQPFGVVEKPGAEFLPSTDTGRFQVTASVDDKYVFKVPSLRNIELTAPYFHTGKSWDLRQAVAVMASSQLGIELTDEEIDKTTSFLRSLTGDQPQVTLPVLPPSVVTTSRPQN